MERWIDSAQKKSRVTRTRIYIYLIICAIALYQGYVLVDEFNSECDTLVELFNPNQVQLPAFSLCVPLYEVFSASIAHWKAQNHQNYTSAAVSYEAFIQDCKSRHGSNKNDCIRNLLKTSGILTMTEAVDGFLLTDSNLYIRLSLMDELMDFYSLHTPMISIAADLCYTYFYKNALTMTKKFGSDKWEATEAKRPHFVNMVLVIQYILSADGRKLSESGYDWSALRTMLWEFHSPLVRSRQFASVPLEPGRTWINQFNYQIMDYSQCNSGDPDDRCVTYAQAHDVNSVLGQDFDLSEAMSQNDCQAKKALQLSSSEWDCFGFGILGGGFTKWTSQRTGSCITATFYMDTIS